jgi:tripartite-type tricarboxylate transporter receptor subunit TctC
MFFATIILSFGLIAGAREICAQAEPFYKGKQIRIITGATAGGFYDRWGRLLARTMPKHIP